MRTAIFFVLVVLIFSCKRKIENCKEPELDCSGIRCIAFHSYFEFRLTDKTTGEDLVFSSSPRYVPGDIRLYYDVGRTISIPLIFDNNKKAIQTMTAKEEMYLEIKGTDTYKITASFRGNDCCSNRVGTLWLDGKMICSCCPDAVSLGIQ